MDEIRRYEVVSNQEGSIGTYPDIGEARQIQAEHPGSIVRTLRERVLPG